MSSYTVNGQTFAQLGITGASLGFTNQAPDTLSFTIPKSDVAAASQFAFNSTVQLKENGTTIFTGTVSATPESAKPKSHAHNYTVSGPWWLLERLPYSQDFDSFEGGHSTIKRPHPAVVLGRNSAGDRVSTMDVLVQIIDYAKARGVNIKAGTLITGFYVPEWTTHSRTVAEIIRQLMAWHPDAVLYFKYGGTGDIVLNVTDRSKAPQQTISANNIRPLTDLGSLVRRDDMAPENVTISWETTQNELVQEFDPQTGITYTEEESRVRLYTESHPNNKLIPGSLFFTLPATAPGGGKPGEIKNHLQKVITRKIPEEGATNSDSRDWWIDHSPLQEFGQYIDQQDVALARFEKEGVQPHRVEFVFDRGLLNLPPTTNPNATPLSPPKHPKLADYPNELVEGSITDWMRTLKHIRDLPLIASTSLALKVSALVNYPADIVTRIRLLKSRLVNFEGSDYLVFDLKTRIIATNAHTKIYKGKPTISPGEPDPVTNPDGTYNPDLDPLVVKGLAEAVYESRTPAQWEGSLTLTKNTQHSYFLGKTVNVQKDGRPEWATMKALVQTESRNLFTGKQSLQLGPGGHLSVQEFITLMKPARRLQRAQAGGSGAGGKDTPVIGTGAVPSRDVQVVTDTRERNVQLRIESLSDNKVRVYYGEAYGLGHNGLIEKTNDRDWETFSVDSGKRFLLKVRFKPATKTVQIDDGNGSVEDVYLVSSGGVEGTVSLETLPLSEAIPPPVLPQADPKTGDVISEGIFWVSIGWATKTRVENTLFGPISLGFCAPSSINLFEMKNTEEVQT